MAMWVTLQWNDYILGGSRSPDKGVLVQLFIIWKRMVSFHFDSHSEFFGPVLDLSDSHVFSRAKILIKRDQLPVYIHVNHIISNHKQDFHF